jgi:hypothetical protein
MYNMVIIIGPGGSEVSAVTDAPLFPHFCFRALAAVTDPIPNLSAAMSIKKVSEVILVRQGNESFFRELAGRRSSCCTINDHC